MSKHITVPFSAAGLERAADWLEEYQKRTLPKNIVELVSRMCRTGEVWAISLINRVDTGNTISTIHGYRNGDKGVIVANGAAIWIEFGTGVYYNGTGYNYPGKIPDGIAAHGTWGEGHGSQMNGWFYPDPNGQYVFNGETYSHTLGMPSNPFMYTTAQMLKRECPQMAKEVFR